MKRFIQGQNVKMVLTDANGERTEFAVHGMHFEMGPEAVEQSKALSGPVEFKLDLELTLNGEQVSKFAEGIKKARERIELALAQHERHVALIVGAYAMKFRMMPARIEREHDKDGSLRAGVVHDLRAAFPIPSQIWMDLFQHALAYKAVFGATPPEDAQAILVPPNVDRDGIVTIVRRENSIAKDVN